MELAQLNSFIQVADSGSFSQAAAKLGLSQPSLSRHLQQLEQSLGVSLLDRYHRPISLTPTGEFFLAYVKPLVEQLEQTALLTQRFAHTPSDSQLTIGFVATVLYGLLPEVISTLKQQFPELNIKLVEVSSEQQMAALKSGEIDVGFGRFRHEDAFVKQIFLRHERLVAALPADHLLSSRPTEQGIALKELVDETLMLYHRTPLPNAIASGPTDPLLYLFEQHGLTPKQTMKVRDLQIALGLVAAGEGVTLVPDSLKTVRTEQIHYHRLYHEDATTPIFMNILAHQPHPFIQPLLSATYHVYERKGITYSLTQLTP